jgi:hypothetical protein
MKQQQFEKTIFEGQPLSKKQRAELNKYMDKNPEAAKFALSWRKLSEKLERSSMHAPKKGFGTRWLAIEQADRRKREQIQAVWALTVSALGLAGVIYLTYGASSTLLPSIVDGILSVAQRALEFMSFLQILTRALLTLIDKMPIAWWGSIVVSLLLLPALWMTVYKEFAVAKGVTK